MNHKDKRFAIGLSFPVAVRNRAKAIADILSATFSQDRILYDYYHAAEFARPNLDTYLQDLYKNETELVVIFICHAYNQREWCGVEWRALRSRLNKKDYASIMFLKVDDGEPDGYFGNVDGSIDISLKTDQEVAKLILERYDINKGNPIIRSESNPYDELENWLSIKFEERRKKHPSFKLMEIDEDLFPDGILKLHDIEALDDANETRTVEEIVAASWNREKNHLMIEGEGGIGKTVTLLSLPDKLAPFMVPAVYVQLHELKGVKENETIEDYIRETYFPSNNTLFHQFQTLADEPWDKGPRVLLLLDGFNEIAPDRRYPIGEDINRWANRSGVQIITSSRYDIHSYVPLGDNYSRILLQPLSRRTVTDYLNKLHITLPDTESQWNIINYPLMLALYAQTQNVIDKMDKDDRIQSFRKNDSAGAIIWNYLQREIWIYRKTNDNADVFKCVLAAEVIAPCIAWQMQKEGLFHVDDSTFEDFFDNSYSQITFINEKSRPPSIQRVLRRSAPEVPDKWKILPFLEDDLHLFVKGKDAAGNDIYTLMHQQFRDALAAMHLINRIYATPGLPGEWEEPIDFYVMNYVADLASQDEADTLWEKNRCLDSSNDASTVNMLELQKRKRNYDFSELSFSGLDLRRISLFPYRLPGSKTLLLPVKKTLNKNLVVSQKTFYPDGLSHSISSISITPDGHKCISVLGEGTVRVWDMATGQCLMTFKDEYCSIFRFDITPDCRLCVMGSIDGTLRVWNLNTGECIKTLNGPKNNIQGLVISPDGRCCVSWLVDNTLQVWDLETGKCLHVLEGLRTRFPTLAFTPDNRRCVFNSEDGRLSVWNLDDGECLQSFIGHKKVVRCLAFTPNGQRCISGSLDGTVCIWETVSWQCLKKVVAHRGCVQCLAITPDGSRFVTASDKTLHVWDLESGECLAVLTGHHGWVRQIVITPNGKICISGADDNTLRIWDINSGKSLRILKGHGSHITALSITPDGRRCVSGDFYNSIRIWDIDSGECLVTIEGHDDVIRCLAIAPDNHRCVFGFGRSLGVWDLDRKEILERFDVPEGLISSLAITPCGHHLITGSSDGSLLIWNLDKEDRPISLKGHEGRICGLAITSDGRRCITGSRDDTLRIWDLESRICLRVIEGESYWFESFAITSDGRLCVNAGVRTLRVWDLETGERIKSLCGHKLGITSLAVTPNGRICISGSHDKTIRFWDLETGKCLNTLGAQKETVRSLAVTPNGRIFISGSHDKTIRIRALVTGKRLGILEVQVGDISSLAITPDGKRLVVGTSTGFLQQWMIDVNPHLESSIKVLPVSLNRVDFSESLVPEDLKEALHQNGAIVN